MGTRVDTRRSSRHLCHLPLTDWGSRQGGLAVGPPEDRGDAYAGSDRYSVRAPFRPRSVFLSGEADLLPSRTPATEVLTMVALSSIGTSAAGDPPVDRHAPARLIEIPTHVEGRSARERLRFKGMPYLIM